MGNIKPFQNKEDGGVLPIAIPENQAWYSREYNATLITQVRVLAQSSGIPINTNANVEHKSVDPLLLAKAVANYCHAGNFYIDSGIANNYILTPANSFDVLDQNNTLHSALKPNMQSTSAILNGMIVRWRPLFSNTGASNITIRCKILTYDSETQLQKISVATYTFPLKLEDGISALTPNKIKNNKDCQARFDAVNACFVIVSGSGGGVSTSYSGDVVNGISTSTITLSNADISLDTITEIKNNFKITITPNNTTNKFAEVTLPASNLTNTKIFVKETITNTYIQVGQNGEIRSGISFDVTYINNQPTVNGGAPFLLYSDISGTGHVINIDDFQHYTATTAGNLITLIPVNGVIINYTDLQVFRFRADANNSTSPVFLKVGSLLQKPIKSLTTLLNINIGDIQAGDLVILYYSAVQDAFLYIKPQDSNSTTTGEIFFQDNVLTSTPATAQAPTPINSSILAQPSISLERIAMQDSIASFDNTTGIITIGFNHGLALNDIIYLFPAIGGVLPVGLFQNKAYYVTSTTANTFKLANDFNGTPIDFTTNGSGTIYYRHYTGFTSSKWLVNLGGLTSVQLGGNINIQATNTSAKVYQIIYMKSDNTNSISTIPLGSKGGIVTIDSNAFLLASISFNKLIELNTGEGILIYVAGITDTTDFIPRDFTLNINLS